MKPEVKERVYLLIIIFSVFMCSAMIITMVSGTGMSEAEEHIPVLRDSMGTVDKVSDTDLTDVQNNGGETNDTEDSVSKDNNTASAQDGQLAVTEEYINERLEEHLPSGFPLKNTAILINDGGISVSGVIKKDELQSYLQNLDRNTTLKYSVALVFLPAEFDISAAFLVDKGEDGKVVIRSDGLTVAGKNIGADSVPDQIVNIISKAVNGTIGKVGEQYRFSGIESGVMLFEKI
ncbi:MAG: hypothetical protein IJE90_00175 [Clostridia bacterium]|nr:hypothetical protein [Clostridia bacterium]